MLNFSLSSRLVRPTRIHFEKGMDNFETNQFPNDTLRAPIVKSTPNDAQKPKKSPWFVPVFFRRYIKVVVEITPIRTAFANTSQRWTERVKSSQPQHSKYPRMATTNQRLTKRPQKRLRSGHRGIEALTAHLHHHVINAWRDISLYGAVLNKLLPKLET